MWSSTRARMRGNSSFLSSKSDGFTIVEALSGMVIVFALLSISVVIFLTLAARLHNLEKTYARLEELSKIAQYLQDTLPLAKEVALSNSVLLGYDEALFVENGVLYSQKGQRKTALGRVRRAQFERHTVNSRVLVKVSLESDGARLETSVLLLNARPEPSDPSEGPAPVLLLKR